MNHSSQDVAKIIASHIKNELCVKQAKRKEFSCIEQVSVNMKINYKKLWILLIEKEITAATLRKDLSIATGTMTKLRKNEEVALSVLLRICGYLHCNIGDICDAVEDTEIKY